jgi:NAD(P)-dependent dehydrogenase (short-subunit alcohol dehydrogenase family)
VLTDFHAARGTKAAQELSSQGLLVEFRHHDAGDETSWRSLAAHVRDRYGVQHVLINNAYSGVAATFDSITPDILRDAMRVNAAGALFGMQLAAELMSEGGAIVNVSSMAAFYPSKANLGYATAKMAMIQLSA